MGNIISKVTKAAGLGLAITLACSCGSDSEETNARSSNTVNSSPSSAVQNSSSSSPNKSSSSSSPVYSTTILGWMTENINTDVGNSLCYDNLPENCEKYGRLYDYESALIACPAGTRLPTKEDWEELIAYVENEHGCEDCAGKYLRSADGWDGEDTYGFAALPGGVGSFGAFSADPMYSFYDAGFIGRWWTSTTEEVNGHNGIQVVAYTCLMQTINGNIGHVLCSYGGSSSSSYYAVRCISNPPQTIQARR